MRFVLLFFVEYFHYSTKSLFWICYLWYNQIDVVDRVGSGDAYCAGVLFGLLKYDDPFKALQFGNATSAMKNTIPGDLPSSDFAEIDGIIANHNATWTVGEMNR